MFHQELNPMKYFAIGNPNGCVLSFVESLAIPPEASRNTALLDWCRNQSHSFDAKLVEGTFNQIIEGSTTLLGAMVSLLSQIGWQTQLARPILSTAIESLLNNGFLSFEDNRLGELTDLGRHLFSNGDYDKYLKSISFKANFWKPNNVLITDNNECGSGSFIGKNTIVTAKHVVEDLKGTIIVQGEDGKLYNIQEIVKHPNPDVDLATILTVEPFGYFTYEIEENCSITEKVIVFGYPPIPLTSKPFLVANLGEISSLVDNYLDKTDCLILSCITRPGNSGGPILNESGKLVGVVIQNRQSKFAPSWDDLANLDVTKGIAYATGLSAKYIRDFFSLA